MNPMKLCWNPGRIECFLHELLRTQAEEYPLFETAEQTSLYLHSVPESPDLLKVSRTTDGGWLVEYSREDLAGRGIAHVLAGQECTEKTVFIPTVFYWTVPAAIS